MLQNAYFLAKIGADTAENEQHVAEICQKLASTLRVHGPALPAVREGRRRRRAPALPRGPRRGRGPSNFRQNFENFRIKFLNFFQKIENGGKAPLTRGRYVFKKRKKRKKRERWKGVHCVDLDENFQTHI